MDSTNVIRVQCNMEPSGRRRRLSDEAIQSERGEMRGVVILVVCGLYAVSMFLLAKLASSLLASLSASVMSMFRVTKQKVKMAPPKVLPQIQYTSLGPVMRKPLQARPIYHG